MIDPQLSRQRRSTSMRHIAIAVLLSAPLSLVGPATPAAAQVTVFDPHNYSQNLLTAARTLQQVNNQIHSLQNQATMLINQAKNLAKIDFPEVQALRQTLHQIDQLMAQAQAIGFQVQHVDAEFKHLFPTFDPTLTNVLHAADAHAQFDASMTAFNHTMDVQAQVVGNVQADADVLASLAAKNDGAVGGLQAQQATNQLLALAAKQQFQIQTLMAAQYRAETLDATRRAQAEGDARAAAIKFLGSGSAYTPQ